MQSKNTITALLTCIVLVAAGLWLLQHSFAKKLSAEFKDAYPKEEQATGVIVEYPLIAQPSTIKLPSGIIQNAWTYNGTTPGPEIRLTLGDTLRIPFTNNLPQETTVHFHGIRVSHAMDGVPGVTQEPIQPRETFVYEFTPKDPGTFWFHPHVRGAEQLERGLYGTIIVEDAYSKSATIDKALVLDDWRLSDAHTINEHFNHPHDITHDGRWGDRTVNSKTHEEFVVQPGSKVRLRLVNTANGRVFRVRFSEEVSLVAVDGMYLEEPMVYTDMDIAPGNRIDIEFIATDNMTIHDTFWSPDHLLANIIVEGEGIIPRAAEYPTVHIPDWNNEEIVAMRPDIEYELTGKQNHGSMVTHGWTLNGNAYGEDVPFVITEDEVVKVRFNNTSGRLHPMHIHGQFFKVVAKNGEAFNEPFWRDTVLLYGGEVVDVLMNPIDAGEWALHCHIQEHAESGMMTTLIVE